MPTCRKCGSKFPNRVKIDGKVRNLQHRWYCLECSPFGQRNTRKLEEPPRNLDRACKVCGREFVYSKKQGHQLNRCNSCVARENKKKRKRKAVEYKGGICVICGYGECDEALDFHHLDSKIKLFSISHGYNRSWGMVANELDKCVLLCCRCHAELHAGVITLGG